MTSRDRVQPRRSDATPQREDEAVAALHPALALQRTVGNRAAAQVLARLAMTAADLGSTGGFGQIKAVVGLSDYTKLREALTDFHQTPSLKERGELVVRMRSEE